MFGVYATEDRVGSVEVVVDVPHLRRKLKTCDSHGRLPNSVSETPVTETRRSAAPNRSFTATHTARVVETVNSTTQGQRRGSPGWRDPSDGSRRSEREGRPFFNSERAD